MRDIEHLKVTRAEFQTFKELQKRRRWDWPATFSANRYRHIWAFVTNGYTPFDLREDLRGVSPLLDRIANKYLMARPDMGRFFISDAGAFFKDETKTQYQFVAFDWVD